MTNPKSAELAVRLFKDAAASKINREKVQRLVENGRMQSPSLEAVDRAKAIEQFVGMLERHEVIHS